MGLINIIEIDVREGTDVAKTNSSKKGIICHYWFWVYNPYFDNLVGAKKLETKTILIDEKNYKNLVIYFTRYVHSKSINMLSHQYVKYCHELMWKIEENKEKIFNHWLLNAR